MKVPVKTLKNYQKAAKVYRAISHPLRLAMIQNFHQNGKKDLTVKSIYRKLGIDQPVASHHLGILKRAGLLNRSISAGDTYYGLKKDDPMIISITNSLKNSLEKS